LRNETKYITNTTSFLKYNYLPCPMYLCHFDSNPRAGPYTWKWKLKNSTAKTYYLHHRV